jgi:hypothetical protein
MIKAIYYTATSLLAGFVGIFTMPDAPLKGRYVKSRARFNK